MPLRFIFFIVLHVFAFAYFLELLRRLWQRNREYPLKDTPETLPFGLIRLRHVLIFYILFYAVWIIVTFWLYFNWLDADADTGLPPPHETILNL